MSKRRGASLPAGLQVGRPMIAVVGRPNVGKSTLFNKLAGKRLALVEDTPGVTRDRHYADSFILGHEVVIIDTGGFDPESDDPMKEGIARQVGLALEECDVVLCVFDGSVEPMQADREAVRLLRDSDRPVVYAANKCETDGRIAQAMSYYELGMDTLLPISALHGRGLGQLDEALRKALPSRPDTGPNELPDMTPRVALIGRPNAGKSSLLNRILGEDRQLVDDRPGTTVDSIDAVVHVDGEPLVLIDTAGMRRQRSVNKGIEGLGVIKAIRSVERCHVAVLMVDADRGIAEQDAKVLGLALDRGRAIIIALNKCDLLDAAAIKEASTRVREVLQFVSWAEIVPISAKTGRGVPKLMKRVKAAVAEHRKRIKTGELNRFFEEVLEHHPPPTYRKKAVRLYFITQAMAGPPTFMVSTNFPQAVHFSYQRYVINQIRERFGFQGTPLRVRYRPKKKRDFIK